MFQKHRALMIEIGKPWLDIKVSRYDDGVEIVRLVGESIGAVTIETVISVSPDLKETVAVPTTHSESQSSLQAMIDSGAIKAADVPEDQSLTDVRTVTEIVLNIQHETPDQLTRSRLLGDPSKFYIEIRTVGDPRVVLAAGILRVAGKVE